MRTVKLMGLAVLALFAFAASGAYAVEAEESNNPRILCLVEPCNPEATLKGGASFLEDLNGKKIEGATAEAKLKGCEELSGKKDFNLCKDIALTFTKTFKEKVACRSENAKGEKDPVETILTLLDLHLAAELHENAKKEKVLLPLLIAKVLGTALEEELKIVCGVVKLKVNGPEGKGAAVIGCLLDPGLENIPITKEVEVLCKVNSTTHDPETGECNVLCADLGAIGVTATLDGTTVVDAWESIHLKGTFNKDIYIDD
jgi:hypothetical protein